MDEQSPAATADRWQSLSLAGGTTSIIFGLVLLIWPHETLLVFAALAGIGLILLGLVRVFSTPAGGEFTGRRRIGRRLIGAAYLIAGILVLVNLHASIRFLVVLVGILWVVSGLSEIISGFGQTTGDRAAVIILGLLSLVFGVVILVWPGPTVIVLVWITGGWLILTGLLQLWFAWRLSKVS